MRSSVPPSLCVGVDMCCVSASAASVLMFTRLSGFAPSCTCMLKSPRITRFL